MNSQDILFIVLAVCTIFVSVPLSLLLWRAYRTMDRVDKLLSYADHVRGLALQFEKMPMKFIDSTIERLFSKK